MDYCQVRSSSVCEFNVNTLPGLTQLSKSTWYFHVSGPNLNLKVPPYNMTPWKLTSIPEPGAIRWDGNETSTNLEGHMIFWSDTSRKSQEADRNLLGCSGSWFPTPTIGCACYKILTAGTLQAASPPHSHYIRVQVKSHHTPSRLVAADLTATYLLDLTC